MAAQQAPCALADLSTKMTMMTMLMTTMLMITMQTLM